MIPYINTSPWWLPTSFRSISGGRPGAGPTGTPDNPPTVGPVVPPVRLTTPVVFLIWDTGVRVSCRGPDGDK